MKSKVSAVVVLCIISGVCASVALAQEPTSGYRAEFLAQLTATENKYVSLAKAVPQDKYTWRPAPGVRSISEVYLHVAGANYGIPNFIGTKPPASFVQKDWETSTTDRDKIVATLKDSFAHLRKAVLALSDGDADKKVKWFGGSENTNRGVLLFFADHMGEHLGQSIAYARVNGVVPPWTEERQRQQQKK
ncbi:MAG: DinB family protein [Candidatus Solibacter usitatus]|nr:DinB family protein [Candidatus Solibacter usitatus]